MKTIYFSLINYYTYILSYACLRKRFQVIFSTILFRSHTTFHHWHTIFHSKWMLYHLMKMWHTRKFPVPDALPCRYYWRISVGSRFGRSCFSFSSLIKSRKYCEQKKKFQLTFWYNKLFISLKTKSNSISFVHKIL